MKHMSVSCHFTILSSCQKGMDNFVFPHLAGGLESLISKKILPVFLSSKYPDFSLSTKRFKKLLAESGGVPRGAERYWLRTT